MKKLLLIIGFATLVSSCGDRYEEVVYNTPAQDFTNADFINQKLQGRWKLISTSEIINDEVVNTDYNNWSQFSFTQNNRWDEFVNVGNVYTNVSYTYEISPKSNSQPEPIFIVKSTTTNEILNYKLLYLDDKELSLKKGLKYYYFTKK